MAVMWGGGPPCAQQCPQRGRPCRLRSRSFYHAGSVQTPRAGELDIATAVGHATGRLQDARLLGPHAEAVGEDRHGSRLHGILQSLACSGG
eukprot:scaffold61580_cov33-Phaeocystis_antarctica.AAC.1